MGETQTKGLREAQLEDLLEEEMVEDLIPKALSKEMKVIVKQKNGQILRVKEEEGVMFPSTPLHPIADIQGPLQHQPHQKTGSSQIGAALDQDLHL